MTPLGHAEAHELLADLALEPGALDRLGSGGSDPLAAHITGCDACRRDVEAWRRTHAVLVAAKGPPEDRVDLAQLAGDTPISVPDTVRDTVLAAARRAPARSSSDGSVVVLAGTTDIPARGGTDARTASARGRVALRRLLPLVAAVTIVVGAAVVADQAARLGRAVQEATLLEAVAASLDRVIRDPDHQVVDLRGADGQANGSLSWSSHDLVVLTTALAPPPSDSVYRCWIEREGKRSPVGVMWFAGDTAFWNGTLDEWATTSFERGGMFGVSLEPLSGPVGNPAVLVAELPD